MELNPYAKYLADADGNLRDPIPVLFSTAATVAKLSTSLTPAQVEHAPAPGKWCLREIIAHLADCELVFAYRLRQTLAPQPGEAHPMIQPFDQAVWGERYSAYDLISALAVFSDLRNWNMHLIGATTEADRRRPTTHPERGTMTFWTIVQTMAGHDIHHLQQLERLTTT